MTGHHGDSEALRRLFQQVDGTANRRFPQGRMGHEDDGELAYAIATDPKHKTIIVRFGKPVEWIGFSPADAVALAEQLIKRAREVADEPLVVSL